ncbi:MAG: autotransporter assembly complex protein TamB [Plesiomonas sp.]|uniref:autotransporter assembly complex protein TamB n=1 Tax=Plesiomonas sp. TaxID=2486279 RepID=UPI003F2C364B
MSALKKLSIGFLITLFLLIAILVGLLGTESGLRVVFHSAARWVPGLDIQVASGNWSRGIHLQGVEYRMPGVDVAVGDIVLQLDLRCLRRSEVCIRQFTVNNVNVAINTALLPASAPSKSTPLTRISTPYPLGLQLLQLDNINVSVDNTQISLAHFTSAAHWREQLVTLKPTEFNGLHVKTVSAVADIPTASPLATSANLAITANNAMTPDHAVEKHTAQKHVASKTMKATDKTPPPVSEDIAQQLTDLFAKPLLPTLPVITLPVDLTIEQIHAKQTLIDTGTPQRIDDLLLSAHSVDNKVTIQTLQVTLPQGHASLSGTMNLAKAFPLQLALNANLAIAPLKKQQVQLTVSGALYKQLNIALALRGDVQAQASLHTELATAGLPLQLSVESKRLAWPLTGTADYSVQNLALKLTGSAKDYQVKVNVAVNGTDLPASKIGLVAQGDLTHVVVQHLRLDTLGGNAQLKGSLAWTKLLKWRADLYLNALNTTKQWPAYPAQLNGHVSTKGELQSQAWAIDVPIFNIKGQALKKPLDLQAVVSGRSTGKWNISTLKLNVGGNNLLAKGVIDKNWNLDTEINAPRLDGILPALGGQVKGRIQLRGALMTPNADIDLTATRLRWQDLQIARLQAKGKVDSHQQIKGNVEISLQNMIKGDLSVNTLTLTATGDERQHQLRFAMQGKPVSAGLRLNGSFDRNNMSWKGTLSQTEAQTPIGPWALQAPVTLVYKNSQQQLTISPLCLTNPNAEICLPQTATVGASGQAQIALRRFDLAMLKPFLGDQMRLKGQLQGQSEIRWRAGEATPTVKASINSNDIAFVQWLMGRRLPIDLSTLALNLNIDKGRLLLTNQIQIKGNGSLDNRIEINDLAGSRQLGGSIKINQLSLGMLSPMLEKSEKAQGDINANLQLGGSLLKPLLRGDLSLNAPELTGAWLPVDITGGNLTLRFLGTSSTLSGALKTPESVLNLSGEANWQKPDQWSAQVKANANRLRVALPPMVRLDVTPDLTFSASPTQIELTGSVQIPWARIKVDSLPESAVDSSSDLVILNNKLQPVEKTNPGAAIKTDLMIRLGDDIRLDAFGLKARLHGNLHVLQNAQGPAIRGTVYLADGRYHSFGQDLLIRKGLLLFVGPPEQPMLNIEAIRNPESVQNNVVAGLRITGLADSPVLTIFSEPAMSQAEALSYLLRGEPLDNGDGDSGAMTSALIGIGLSQGSQLVGQIGQAFGISDLSLDTQGAGDNSQVVVSGYILPGLQVKYGVGIFDSLAELTLRYRLMPSLYLQAISGLNQAFDILYQFEF